MSRTQYTLICTNTHLSLIVTQGCTQPSIQVYILEPTEQVPEKAFWLTFKTRCTKTPWLSSFRVQESFFPDEAASRMQATTISGKI